MLQQVAEELAQVLAVPREFVQFTEHQLHIAFQQTFREGKQLRLRSKAEHREHVRLDDGVPAKTDELIERAFAVAHSAVRAARDGVERRFINGHALLARDHPQMIHHQLDGNAAQIEPLAARENGRQNLLRLRRGEHELHMRRRLFERLEERVEGLLREHVNFVNDVNFELRGGGRVLHCLAQLADFLDATIARAVNFQHVERAAFGDFNPLRIVLREIHLRTACGVQTLGEDARDRRLARAARAAEQVGVRDAARLDGVAERLRDVLLADDIGEPLGAVLARDDLIGGGHSRFQFLVFFSTRTAGGSFENSKS